jgi:hypothetical protein
MGVGGGIVNGDVQTAELLDSLFYQGLCFGLMSGMGGNGNGPAWKFLIDLIGNGADIFNSAAADNNTGPGSNVGPGTGQSNAPRGTGDDGDFVGQIEGLGHGSLCGWLVKLIG